MVEGALVEANTYTVVMLGSSGWRRCILYTLFGVLVAVAAALACTTVTPTQGLGGVAYYGAGRGDRVAAVAV